MLFAAKRRRGASHDPATAAGTKVSEQLQQSAPVHSRARRQVEAARAQAVTKSDRCAVDAAAALLAQEESRTRHHTRRLRHDVVAAQTHWGTGLEEGRAPNNSYRRIWPEPRWTARRRSVRLDRATDPALSADRGDTHELTRGGTWPLHEVVDGPHVPLDRRPHLSARDGADAPDFRLPAHVLHGSPRRRGEFGTMAPSYSTRSRLRASRTTTNRRFGKTACGSTTGFIGRCASTLSRCARKPSARLAHAASRSTSTAGSPTACTH